MRPDIRSISRDQLLAQVTAWDQPAYRGDQVLAWLYRHHVRSWDEMTNVPKALREKMAGPFGLHLPELVKVQGSSDTTRKFLWRLADAALIESVLIPANPALYGEASDRLTLCISTQVGCAYGCRFCASGLDGWKRNLLPHEIVGQVLAASEFANERAATSTRETGSADLAPANSSSDLGGVAPEETPSLARRRITNIVVMGMGEPLANYDNLMAALRILNAPWGGGIGARKITISTSGLAPQIRKLAEEAPSFRLAISLHGATDAVRDRIMPVNRKYPLRELVAACEYYQESKGRMITLEYILLEGVNDRLDQAPQLAQLALRLHAKVNVIPYNQVPGLPWNRPSDEACERFTREIEQRGVVATLRHEKGHDIDAACGQLRLRVEREAGAAA